MSQFKLFHYFRFCLVLQQHKYFFDLLHNLFEDPLRIKVVMKAVCFISRADHEDQKNLWLDSPKFRQNLNSFVDRLR